MNLARQRSRLIRAIRKLKGSSGAEELSEVLQQYQIHTSSMGISFSDIKELIKGMSSYSLSQQERRDWFLENKDMNWKALVELSREYPEDFFESEAINYFRSHDNTDAYS